MHLRLALYRVADEHRLDAAATTQLEHCAGLADVPRDLARRLARGLSVLAAALVGLGLVFWVAANWPALGRLGRFALLQGAVVLLAAVAFRSVAARVAGALLVMLSGGALLAFFGQTYQTGADPWQLFALWALLGLPLALGVRHDVLWAPWALVAMTAVALWVRALGGSFASVQAHDLPAHAVGAALALGLVALLSPPLRPLTGAGAWALRTAVLLAVAMVSVSALGGLFQEPVTGPYALGLAVMGVLVVALAIGPVRGVDLFDLAAVCAAALGLNVLLIAGLARVLFDAGGQGDPLGRFLLLGLAAAGLLAATVWAVLRRQRAHDARLIHDQEAS